MCKPPLTVVPHPNSHEARVWASGLVVVLRVPVLEGRTAPQTTSRPGANRYGEPVVAWQHWIVLVDMKRTGR